MRVNTVKMLSLLEALLRLRQAACHPGLIDQAKAKEPSAKLDLVLEQVDEVIANGHKALIFSQFTSLLSIVRQRLDKAKTKKGKSDLGSRGEEVVRNEFEKDDNDEREREIQHSRPGSRPKNTVLSLIWLDIFL